MLPDERREALLAIVRSAGSARVVDLAVQLGVSGMTVRRDVEELEAEGLLTRVRGGVRLVGLGAPVRPPTSATAEPPSPGLRAAARLAAQGVRSGSSVGLSSGPACELLAHELRDVPDLTFVTTSLAVAAILDGPSGQPSQSVVLTGGVRTPAGALVGPVAVRALGHVHCDVVFLSVHGIDPRAGLTSPNILEAETNRALLASARRSVVVAEHTAWKDVSLTTIADVDAVDAVVLDVGLAPEELTELRDLVADVQVADV